MSWMERMIFGGFMLRAPDGDGAGGGSGGAGGDGDKGKGGEGDKGKGAGDELSALKAANKALEERLAKLEAGGKKDDDGLDDKARKEREAKDKVSADSKAIETALKFSLGAKDWLKNNAAVLPKDIEGIFNAAEKENYGSAIEKDAAIKSAMITEFFKLQANLDLLTPSQKSALEDFSKLTKNGRQEKAQQVYEQIFEPTFEMLKRLKKAEQLRESGHASSNDVENAYRDRMMSMSKKHYMGEKANA